MSNSATLLPPGFRFHPTDEELINHYLRNRAASRPCPVSIIADVDIYKFDPWELPAKSVFGEKEWYFFTPRDRKYPNGVRPNRAAASGYWKATGTDKPIVSSDGKQSIGVKKALVFYKGRPPKGIKTDWIMHEYRLTEAHQSRSARPMFRDCSMRLDDWVLCRIYKKSSQPLSAEREQSTPSTSQPSTLMMQKSTSLSDLLDSVDYSLLSRLLDNSNEFSGAEQCHIGISNEPSINCYNNGNGYSSQLLMGQDSTTSAAKRQRTMDDRADVQAHQPFFSQMQYMQMSTHFGLQ